MRPDIGQPRRQPHPRRLNHESHPLTIAGSKRDPGSGRGLTQSHWTVQVQEEVFWEITQPSTNTRSREANDYNGIELNLRKTMSTGPPAISEVFDSHSGQA